MIQIKQGTINDLLRFQCNMALETESLQLDEDALSKGIAAVLADSNKGTYYLAQQQGKNVGCLLVTSEWSEWRNGTVLWIQSVYVHPNFRKQGIYTQLYQHVKQQVEACEELKGIRLYADKTNSVAQQVYEHLGMNGEHYQLYEWLKG